MKNSSVAASFGLSLIVGMVLLLLVAQRTQVARDINDDSDRPMLLQDFPYLARLESAPTQSLYQAPWFELLPYTALTFSLVRIYECFMIYTK